MADPQWPSVRAQLDHVQPNSALERLVRENQELHLLRDEEAADRLGLPPWLRIYWRKQHPELHYAPDDPTGGYPRVLKQLHAWMLANPDLPGGPDTPESSSPSEADA